jgi:hypothetical protein
MGSSGQSWKLSSAFSIEVSDWSECSLAAEGPTQTTAATASFAATFETIRIRPNTLLCWALNEALPTDVKESSSSPSDEESKLQLDMSAKKAWVGLTAIKGHNNNKVLI